MIETKGYWRTIKNELLPSGFQVAGQLVLDLNEEGVYAEVTDIDDRRNVFHIVAPLQKKWAPMFLGISYRTLSQYLIHDAYCIEF